MTSKANTVRTFILDLVERAAKTAGQAALLQLGYTTLATGLNVAAVNWVTVGEFAAGGFILSSLTSIVSANIGANDTASLVPSVGQVTPSSLPVTTPSVEPAPLPTFTPALFIPRTPAVTPPSAPVEAPTVAAGPTSPPLAVSPTPPQVANTTPAPADEPGAITLPTAPAPTAPTAPPTVSVG